MIHLDYPSKLTQLWKIHIRSDIRRYKLIQRKNNNSIEHKHKHKLNHCYARYEFGYIKIVEI